MNQPQKQKYLTDLNKKLRVKIQKDQINETSDFLLSHRVKQEVRINNVIKSLAHLVSNKDYKEANGVYKKGFNKEKAWDFARDTLEPFGYKNS